MLGSLLELIHNVEKMTESKVELYGSSKAKESLPSEIINHYKFVVFDNLVPDGDVYIVPVSGKLEDFM